MGPFDTRSREIKLIIFDLGRVLIDFDFRKVVRELGRYTALPSRMIYRYFENTPLWDAFERGRVGPEEFYRHLQHSLKIKGLTYAQFLPIWNGIFTERHDTVAVVKRLYGKYRLAILSNVNILHWAHVADHHGFIEWFDHPIASFEVGYRKPDPEIFRLTLHHAGVHPWHAVFVDDLVPHIRAAQSVGIRAYQFIDARQFQSDIADLLT